ncbi:MAG: hypothetical protein KF690_10705, partial [Bacteroidetes bacterium]|nr:hypothetical protein [Bacteroidota bacterium]
LTKAVYNSLRLLLTPWDTIVKFFFAEKDLLKLEDLQRYAVFFRDFDFIVKSLVAAYAQKGAEEIARAPFLEKLDKAAGLYAERTGESLDAYREARFLALTGQSLSSWMMAATPVPRQGINTLPGVQAPVPVAVTPPAAEPPVAETTPSPVPARQADKFQAAKGNPAAPTVAKAPAIAPGALLTLESIPLHKQFQYIQKVFGGDAQRMKDTLIALNQLETSQEIADYLRTRIFNMPDNTHDAKINQEFLEFAQQRLVS